MWVAGIASGGLTRHIPHLRARLSVRVEINLLFLGCLVVVCSKVSSSTQHDQILTALQCCCLAGHVSVEGEFPPLNALILWSFTLPENISAAIISAVENFKI